MLFGTKHEKANSTNIQKSVDELHESACLKNIRYGRDKDQLVYTRELDYMPASDANDL